MPSITATFTPVRMPGSRPMVGREPAGAASSRSLRLRANTWIASSSARWRSSIIRSTDSESESFTRQVQRATSSSQRSAAVPLSGMPWASAMKRSTGFTGEASSASTSISSISTSSLRPRIIASAR